MNVKKPLFLYEFSYHKGRMVFKCLVLLEFLYKIHIIVLLSIEYKELINTVSYEIFKIYRKL